MPGLFDSLAKQAIRGFSWAKTRKNPEIINKTYPQKYKAAVIHDSLFPDEFKKEQREAINSSMQEAMQKLYREKQKIKNNPEGWLGLSEQQKEKCRRLNASTSWFRRITIPYYHPDYLGNPKQINPMTPERRIIYASDLFSEVSERGLILLQLQTGTKLSEDNLLITQKSNTYERMPILIKKGREFSIHGYQNGKWQRTKLDNLSATEQTTLNNLSFIGSDLISNYKLHSQHNRTLFQILKRGHTPSLFSDRTDYLVSIVSKAPSPR